MITRARNYCADEFMRSDCTHMLFIDSDISFSANDVIAMLALMSEDSEYDILCAPYPKKCISWEKIKQACDLGAADKDPNVLEKFVGDYNIREMTLIAEKKDSEINTNIDIQAFESVDQIVSSQIISIESEQFDKNTLLAIYNNL